MKITNLVSVAIASAVALGVFSTKASTTVTNFALLNFDLVALQQNTTTNKGTIKDSIQKTKLSNKEILSMAGATLGVTIPANAQLALDNDEDVVVLTNGAVFLNLDEAETTTAVTNGSIITTTYGYADDSYLEFYDPVFNASASTNGGFNSPTNTFKGNGSMLTDGELYFEDEIYTNGVYESDNEQYMYFDYGSTSISYSQKDGNFKESFDVKESGELETYQYPTPGTSIYTPFYGTVKGKATGSTADIGDLQP
jgi:hypothetical protein